MRVEDIMTTEVASARPDTPLKDVARTLAERSISGCLSLDADGRLLGRHLGGRPVPRRTCASRIAPDSSPDYSGAGTSTRPPRVAADAMSAPAVTVEPFWSIPGAAALMRDHRVKRLPVVRRGRVVGMVSRADIVRAIARTDAEIQQEVRDLIAFHQGLWSDSLPVDVSLVDGETTLTGEVQRRSMAGTLPELIGEHPRRAQRAFRADVARRRPAGIRARSRGKRAARSPRACRSRGRGVSR